MKVQLLLSYDDAFWSEKAGIKSKNNVKKFFVSEEFITSKPNRFFKKSKSRSFRDWELVNWQSRNLDFSNELLGAILQYPWKHVKFTLIKAFVLKLKKMILK